MLDSSTRVEVIIKAYSSKKYKYVINRDLQNITKKNGDLRLPQNKNTTEGSLSATCKKFTYVRLSNFVCK